MQFIQITKLFFVIFLHYIYIQLKITDEIMKFFFKV